MRWYVLLGFGLLTLLARAPVASAQNQCVGLIGLDYTNPPLQFLSVGAVLNVQGTLGAGNVVGGDRVLFNKVQIQLDCVPSPTLTPQNCVDAGPAVSYLGDATISTNCGVVWTSNNPGGGVLPNTVEFTASPILQVPELNPIPPGFCNLSFDLEIVNEPPVVPQTIAQILGYALAVCNTSPVLTTSGFQTASGSFAQEVGAHFQCNETPRHSTVKPNELVSVSDQFGSDPSVNVVRSQDLCAPVDKNGEDPTAPANPVHLGNYLLGQVNAGAFPTQRVTATNQFGDFVLDVKVPTHLLVPTAKSIVPAPPPMALPPDAADHYLCHKVGVVSQPNIKTIPLALIDQFSTPNDFPNRLESVARLCAPASKNGAAILDPATHLLCFNTNPPKPPTGRGPLNLELNLVNQFFNFGPREVDVTHLTDFCAASTVVIN